MLRNLLAGALAAMLLIGVQSNAIAGTYGTMDEAKAMVTKAIELYRDKGSNSFSIINKGTASGFRDRCEFQPDEARAHDNYIARALQARCQAIGVRQCSQAEYPVELRAGNR